MDIHEQLHSIDTAAERLQIAPKTLRNWVGERRIAVYRIGRRVRIPESEIQRVLEEGYCPVRLARGRSGGN